MVPSSEPHTNTSTTDAPNSSEQGTVVIHNQLPQTEWVTPQQDTDTIAELSPPVDPNETKQRKSKGISLRYKATALAIAIGTLPVLAIGATAYRFARQAFVKQVIQGQVEKTSLIANKANGFMLERYGDLQTLSSLAIFTDPQLRSQTTLEQKQEILDGYIKNYKAYDSIAVLDLEGNILFQSQGAALPNQGDQLYFQFVKKNAKSYIDLPTKSPTSEELVIHAAAPIRDRTTSEMIAILRTRMPVKQLANFLLTEGVEDEYHILDAAGEVFIATGEEYRLGREFFEHFPGLAKPLITRKSGSEIVTDIKDNKEEIAAYTPTQSLEGLPDLYWQIVLLKDTSIAFAPLQRLETTLILGTGLTALLVGLLAAYLANRATKPILTAADTVERLGEGELDSRIPVKGNDELATLGSNINSMAARLQQLLDTQAAEAERIKQVKDITVKLVQYTQIQDIFESAVMEARQALKVDRVVVYTFDERWQGTVVAESVVAGFPQALGVAINDPCFADKYVERYQQGRIQATDNIYTAGLTECHINQLEQFAVKANLVAPILQDGQLLGLLIAHQCSVPRSWQQSEIDLFSQVASQVGFALDRAKLLEQQQTAKEQLQQRALELLQEVDPVSRGDLTIRAKVTADEIGTVADSYNATINSLRQIVATVQNAAAQVANTTSSNEVAVAELSTEALRQAEEIALALEKVRQMSLSIQAVAESAAQAEAAVQQANETVLAGDRAMNRTVDGIEAIRETVAETSAKVRQLGESSQKISKVVSLISSFAEQTSLLSLNAAIEAARAGEEGRGFAVVADEVGSLARQSAEATAEIEKLVAEIQAETNALVAAMEAGTERVVTGTRLVDETRQSLNKITVVSAQISSLVQAISEASVMQSQASEEVTKTMSDVAAIADRTSNEATQVSAAFKQLLAVADEMQTSVGQFKVN
ncbi:methyl-accepting chemotaxis protein [Chroogloeocystis siderophila]|uniref:methyl-accepting chemotaxis protein n=1 Tax=Chroogloeocystis siderophila TaxID=329163 RepID=UPI0009373AED|nr:methyl-accepting chemotaxis protein [Chroogloeocystis siderophila]